MAGETIITVVGNLTADPELRFTPSGAAVSNFVIASTPRFFDRQANEWKDGETLFVRCSLWREAAENAAESLTKGTRVIAQGRLKARSFETKEGERRTSWELDVDEIGPSLRFATASVQRQGRGGGGGGFNGGGGGGGFGGGAAAGAGFGGGGDSFGGGGGQQSSGGWGGDSGGGSSDPWGGQPSGGGWDTPDTNEPPF
ncbi:single-stranded DNA-binding protein [Nesterenkonia sp. CL21]|uniref:single-stranded DNA-binding protein n=1 Tax=Nesterenkonia sp. CL21 TaxID=3064894 RepID=UPI0028783D6F|nr:single-stranded DNA-binding protein [Nesterenkonia sp. CL21]MDS2173461.1 single-stranded DNA-binding protein [Nesterenkonia sp. CL21]